MTHMRNGIHRKALNRWAWHAAQPQQAQQAHKAGGYVRCTAHELKRGGGVPTIGGGWL